jgi:ABC-type dipeptide/oligopeptide/nickel transport system permease subunit
MRPSIPGSGTSRAAAQVGGGALVIGVALLCAVFGARLAPYDPLRYNPRHVLEGPSARHVVGTDPLGRDVLSQIIAGARISMVVSVLSVAAGLCAGTGVGLVAGLAPGRGAGVLMRAMDALLVFPSLVLALTITAFLGARLWNVIGALAVTFIPTFAILVRGEVLALSQREFVTAAWALGAVRRRVMWRHLVPNLADVLLVQASFGIGTAILTEASLSFLGLGVPPPALSWGRMLREGYSFVLEAPWIAVASGGAIFVVVLACQTLADGLQAILARRTQGAATIDRPWSAGLAALLRRVLGRRRPARV